MLDISLSDDLDFSYLLELMLPLYDEEGFILLPELFSTIGAESLIKLCRYAGGETIKIPTVSQLASSVTALQWLYNIRIRKCNVLEDVPPEHQSVVSRLLHIYDDRFDET